jgi:hypothetical protein
LRSNCAESRRSVPLSYYLINQFINHPALLMLDQ